MSWTLLKLALLLVVASCAAQERETNHVSAPAGMAFIPAGTFTPLFKGQDDRSKVPVEAFFLDVFPVTNGDYLKFVQANSKWRKSSVKRLFAEADYLKLWNSD